MSDITANLARQALARPGLPGQIERRLRQAGQNPTIHAILWLAQRHITARLISGLSILISAWAFAPADFAAFGSFLVALNLVGLLIFLRYESVIVAAASEAELQTAICLNSGALAVTLVGLTVAALVATSGGWIAPLTAALFVVALALRGISRLMGGLITRQGLFELIGQTTTLHAISLPVTVLTAYTLDWNGAVAMIASDIVANLLVTVLQFTRVGRQVRDALAARQHWTGVLAMARDWLVLPTVNLPAAVLAMLFAQLPLILVLFLAPPVVAGQMALLFRLLDFPVQLVLAVSTPVLMNRLARGAVRWSAMPIVIAGLGGVVLAIFGTLAFAAALLEPLLPDTAWSGMSRLLPLVLIFQGALALTGPLIEISALYRRQVQMTAIHAAAVIGLTLTFALSRNWQAALMAVSVIALLRAALIASRLVVLSRQRDIAA